MHPRLLHAPPRALRTVVAVADHGRVVATAGALTLVLGLAAVQGLPHGSDVTHRSSRTLDSATTLTPTTARTEALLHRAGCSSTGLDGATPRSAILREPDGDLRLVGVDRGWAALTGDAPGEMLAVCRPAAP